jgi:hypothetical protein
MKTFVLCALGLLLTAQDSREIKLVLRKDPPLRLKLSTMEETVSLPGGSTEKRTARRGMELGLESQGSGLVKVSLLRLQSESGDRKTDSADPGDGPQGAFLGKLIGEYVLVELGLDGRLIETRGAGELEARFAKKLGLKPEDPGPHKGLAEGLVPRLRAPVEELFALFPPKAVAPGATWTRKVSTRLDVPRHSEVVWTLQTRKESKVHLSAKWTHAPFPDADAKSAPLKVVQTLQGTGEGTMELDDATGWPLKGSVVHQLKGSSTIEGLKAPLPSDTSEDTTKMTVKVEPWDGR